LEPAFPSGWLGFDLCSSEVAQQVLFAQQPGLQLCRVGALERMHEREARLAGAVESAAAIASEIRTLLIEFGYSTDGSVSRAN